MTPLVAPKFGSYRPVHRITVAQYDRMVQTGVLGESDRVELLDGFVVEKMSRNPRHDSGLQRLARVVYGWNLAGWDIRVQMAVTLSTSKPEPDLAVVRGSANDYESHHPLASEIGLIIEVSDTSLDHDRVEKSAIYARDGLSPYWVVNLIDGSLELYENPVGGTYQLHTIYRPGDVISVRLDGGEVARLAVESLFK